MAQAITHYSDGKTFKDLSDDEKLARICTRCDDPVNNRSSSGVCRACTAKAVKAGPKHVPSTTKPFDPSLSRWHEDNKKRYPHKCATCANRITRNASQCTSCRSPLWKRKGR